MANWSKIKLSPTVRTIILIATPAVVVDQMSKYAAFYYFRYPSEYLPPNSASRPLIPNFLDITCSLNTGVAFGMGQGMNLFFTLFTAIIIVVMMYNHALFTINKVSTWGFALVISGAVGNLIDRIFYDAVRDFIDTHWYEHHWPIFNVADSCISVGVVMLLLASFKESKADTLDP